MRYLKARGPAIVLLIILFLMAVLTASSLTATVGRIDDARYLTLSEGLATGQGFVRIDSPARPPEQVLPPGYPLLLAPLWWLPVDLATRVVLAKLLSCVAGAASVLLLYYYLVHFQYAGRWRAATVAMLTATNPLQFLYAREVASEALYAVVSLLGLIWLETYAAQQKGRSHLGNTEPNVLREHGRLSQALARAGGWLSIPFVLALAGIAASYYVRSVGLALPIAAILLLLLSGRYRQTAWIAGGASLVIAPWVVRGVLAAASEQGYFSQLLRRQMELPELGNASLLEFLARVLDNSRIYLVDALGGELFPSLSSQNWLNLPGALRLHSPYLPLLTLASVALISMLFAGVLMRRRLLYLYVACFVALCVVWPWDPSRLLVPIVGLLWFVLLEPMGALLAILRRKNRLALLSALPLMLFLLWNMMAVARYSAQIRHDGHDMTDTQLALWNDSQSAFEWVRSNTAPDSVLASTNDALVYLHTNRLTSRLDVDLHTLLALRVQYLVLVPTPTLQLGLDLSQVQFARLSRQAGATFSMLYRSGQAAVLRVDSMSPPEP